ncbi:MAG: hypothetical protein M9894_18950 [Planctomycetes bacterium]|nr:hypothetical protein [Planctomycetota bacterium]
MRAMVVGGEREVEAAAPLERHGQVAQGPVRGAVPRLEASPRGGDLVVAAQLERPRDHRRAARGADLEHVVVGEEQPRREQGRAEGAGAVGGDDEVEVGGVVAADAGHEGAARLDVAVDRDRQEPAAARDRRRLEARVLGAGRGGREGEGGEDEERARPGHAGA